MGLYNFRPEFVPYILDGSKTHTIRAERKVNDVPGNTMHLYTGLRQKGARRLMRVPCVKTEFVRIELDYRVRIGARLNAYDPHDIGGASVPGGFIELDESEKDALAWRDGFRPPLVRLRSEDFAARVPSAEDPRGCFTCMIGFWMQRLPFEGWILHWDYSRRKDVARTQHPAAEETAEEWLSSHRVNLR